LQWGDEAKGKLVDLLTARFEIVVRYQGGANAGHTVVVGDKTYKLHHVPSGILTPGVMNVVTPGVVVSPPTILKEIDSLTAQGVNIGNNMILSERAHVVFPWHIAKTRCSIRRREAKASALPSVALALAIAIRSAVRTPFASAICSDQTFMPASNTS